MRGLNISINEIRATGGGAKSPLWLDILANVSGESIATMASDEAGAAYGAAVLAGVGSGVFTDLKEACENMIHTGDKVVPETQRMEQYNNYFLLFRSLYPLLKDSYIKLGKL